jgi:hypothetical protein
MKETDWRKTLEVVVKGLVGAVLALAGLWLLGWLFTFIGSVLLGLAGVIGALLRFLIPVAAIAGIVYFIFAQVRPREPLYSTRTPEPSSEPSVTNLEPVVTPTSAPEVPISEVTAPVEPLEPKISSDTPLTDTPPAESSFTDTAPEASTDEPSSETGGGKKGKRKTS